MKKFRLVSIIMVVLMLLTGCKNDKKATSDGEGATALDLFISSQTGQLEGTPEHPNNPSANEQKPSDEVTEETIQSSPEKEQTEQDETKPVPESGKTQTEQAQAGQTQPTGEKSATISQITLPETISSQMLDTYGFYYDNSDGDIYIPYVKDKYSSSSPKEYVNQKGEVVIQNVTGARPGNFTEGFAFVEKNVIDKSGNIVFTFDKSVSHTPFNNGYALTLRKERDSYGANQYYIGVLDKNMNYTEKIVSSLDGFYATDSDWFLVNDDSFRGVIGSFSNKTVQGQTAIINTDGQIIKTMNGQKAVQSAKNAFSIVCFSSSMTHSKAISYSDSDLTKIFIIKNGYVNVIDDGGKWGLMNLQTGQMAINYSFDYVGGYSDGVVPVCQAGQWGAVDLQGNTVIPCKGFKYIGSFVGGKAIAVNEQQQVCVIDKKGTVIKVLNVDVSGSTMSGTTKSFFYTDFVEKTGIACIYLYEKAYVINNSGDILVSLSNDSIESHVEAFLYMNNKYLVAKDAVYEIRY